MGIQAVFAENMRKYRKKAKLTQEKLAEICGTDHRYIGQIETGLRCPSLDFVERIASALNIAQREQKQKIKILLFENFSRICSIIDEQ